MLRQLFNEFLEIEIPNKIKETTIITIFKKGDKQEIANRRPISLLNTDYIIYSKIITNRLNKTLPKIINIYQNGFVPNRKIQTNILTVKEIKK
jgi:hypothetical protein